MAILRNKIFLHERDEEDLINEKEVAEFKIIQNSVDEQFDLRVKPIASDTTNQDVLAAYRKMTSKWTKQYIP